MTAELESSVCALGRPAIASRGSPLCSAGSDLVLLPFILRAIVEGVFLPDSGVSYPISSNSSSNPFVVVAAVGGYPGWAELRYGYGDVLDWSDWYEYTLDPPVKGPFSVMGVAGNWESGELTPPRSDRRPPER
jgi:hypothetical protein